MITILMAAYNGEAYIGAQIESILGQKYNNWKLIIQDDSSTDGTYMIMTEYAQRYPDKIKVFRRFANSGGASNNFFSMLPYADTPYIMFSDDDDVWANDKIMRSLEKMQELERITAPGTPLLVHTDLEVVDAALHRIAKSFFRMQKLDSRRSSLNYILAQNIVTGCTAMVNRELIGIIGTPPAHAVMHDWWMALIAAAFGKIGFIDTPAVLYRQHKDNAVGAKSADSVSYSFRRLFAHRLAAAETEKTYLQAGEFAERYIGRLSPGFQQMIADFICLRKRPIIHRIRILRKHVLWKKGLLRKLAQVLKS